MENHLKLRILDVKSVTHYLVKEEKSAGSQTYANFEQVLQKGYNFAEEYNYRDAEELVIGSYVAVFTNADHKRQSPKLWLRAVIKNIFNSVGSFLYSCYLLDYGLEKCCDKFSIRPLKPHFTHAFVAFQAFHFHLSSVVSENGINSREANKYVKSLLKENNDCVSALIHKKDESGLWSLGSISLNDGLDLATLLIDKGLVKEPNGVTFTRIKEKTIDLNAFIIDDKSAIRKPHSSPFIRCANNSIVKSPQRVEHMNGSPKESINKTIAETDTQLQNGINGIEISESSKPINSSETSNCNLSNGPKRKPIKQLLKQLKETQTKTSQNESLDQNESETNEEIDWPTFGGKSVSQLKPAGCQPSQVLFDKYFTLNRKSL